MISSQSVVLEPTSVRRLISAILALAIPEPLAQLAAPGVQQQPDLVRLLRAHTTFSVQNCMSCPLDAGTCPFWRRDNAADLVECLTGGCPDAPLDSAGPGSSSPPLSGA